MTTDREMFRIAVLTTFVKRVNRPGRTALMKFAYFLQALRSVPLGYRFKLYNYGPYDSSVLGDLSQAGSLKAIKATSVVYSGTGSGYEYEPGKSSQKLCDRVAAELQAYDRDIQWVVDRFGDSSASMLELYSTIVFVDREARRKQKERSFASVAQAVARIKPHFTSTAIRQAIEKLIEMDVVVGLAEATEA